MQQGDNGLHFLYIKRNGLYFVCATKFNVGPAFILELLSRSALHSSTTCHTPKFSEPYPHASAPSKVHAPPCAPRIAGLCKDYCGVLNEEAIRLNFVLVYELLDEVLVSQHVCFFKDLLTSNPLPPLTPTSHTHLMHLPRILATPKAQAQKSSSPTSATPLVLYHTTPSPLCLA